MYGTQTLPPVIVKWVLFENDVEMYGTQTKSMLERCPRLFENDVEMYGTQTYVFNELFKA